VNPQKNGYRKSPDRLKEAGLGKRITRDYRSELARVIFDHEEIPHHPPTPLPGIDDGTGCGNTHSEE
jgi:hypothetical protein